MNKLLVPWADVPQLSKTDVAYASGDPLLRPFIAYQPDYQSFGEIFAELSARDFPRDLLVEILLEQYEKIGSAHPAIEKLRSPDTFTVVTAHQPTLFLHPLFVFLKAFTAINLVERLAELHPEKNFIPVFVLGSEDHDIEELNNASVFGKKLVWQPVEPGGSVGLMNTASVAPVLAELRTILGESENARSIFGLLEKAYSSDRNFAESTQYLLHELLGKFGLVTLNMDDRRLKQLFVPMMKRELFEQVSHRIVSKTIDELAAFGFKTQAAPREINLFYRTESRRDRIVPTADGGFEILNTGLIFSRNEMAEELENRPERFSPNVVMRPLFQQLILPNLAYVGGGGELAYWLERKAQFAEFGVAFPMLVRRASLLWVEPDVQKKWERLGFSTAELFLDTEFLVKKFVEKQLSVEVSLAEEVESMRLIFNKLATKAKAIDPTLEAAVGAEQAKQVAVLEHWEGRLRRAEKQKHEVSLGQLKTLREKLFPGGGLQERSDGLLTFWVKHGPGFLKAVKDVALPFEPGFVVVTP